jgi:hypothetical protein
MFRLRNKKRTSRRRKSSPRRRAPRRPAPRRRLSLPDWLFRKLRKYLKMGWRLLVLYYMSHMGD